MAECVYAELVNFFSEIILRIRIVALLILLLVSVSGCWLKGVGNSEMAFKRITPRMERQMEYLLVKGCDEEQKYLDPDVAMLYSILPGGGQFYAGESKKGLIYLLSSPFILPYLVSFKDAQNSVDYYNFQYTIRFCAKKFGLVKSKPRPRSAIPRKGLSKASKR